MGWGGISVKTTITKKTTMKTTMKKSTTKIIGSLTKIKTMKTAITANA